MVNARTHLSLFTNVSMTQHPDAVGRPNQYLYIYMYIFIFISSFGGLTAPTEEDPCGLRDTTDEALSSFASPRVLMYMSMEKRGRQAGSQGSRASSYTQGQARLGHKTLPLHHTQFITQPIQANTPSESE